MNKSTIIKWGLGLLTVLILTSTTCSENHQVDSPIWWEISGGNVTFSPSQSNDFLNNGPIVADTLLMQALIMCNIENNDAYTEILLSNSNAPELKHSISSLVITSDHEFNSIATGQPLNEFLIVLIEPYFNYSISKWVYSNTLSIQDFIYKYLVQGTQVYNYNNLSFTIQFMEKPAIANHTFTLDFTDSQGTHFIIKSEPIIWN